MVVRCDVEVHGVIVMHVVVVGDWVVTRWWVWCSVQVAFNGCDNGVGWSWGAMVMEVWGELVMDISSREDEQER